MEKVHQLAVEDTIRQECKEQNVDDKFTWILQGISVKFVESLPLFPLPTSNGYPGEHSQFPGVYPIYCLGQKLLFGDLVSPSNDQPVYVRMSKTRVLLAPTATAAKCKKRKTYRCMISCYDL